VLHQNVFTFTHQIKSYVRTTIAYTLEDPLKFKQNLLYWSRQFEEIAWLDSNSYEQQYGEFDALLAVGAFTAIKTDAFQAFAKLQEYQQTTKDWIFGYLSYDLKNDVEALSSKNHDGLDFPDLYFFQPQKIFLLKGDQLEICYLNMLDDEVEDDFNEISNLPFTDKSKLTTHNPEPIRARISKEEYLQKVDKMLAYIQRGEIYEANFCQEFFAENREI